MILILVSAFIILLVNTFLRILLRKLGKYERYSTVTKEVSSSTMKIFRAMFINTALITLLIHARIGDFVLSIEISNIIPPLKNYMEGNESDYPNDFNTSWYLDVGSKIMTTLILSIVSPHLTWMIITFFLKCWKSFLAKRKIVQREMNNTLLTIPFDLTAKYALALNIIFVSLFYSSGMPILLLFASLSLYNSKPPEYSSDLNYKILKILPYAIIFHLAIAIWAYGAEGVFPEKISTTYINNSIGESQILQKFQDTEIINRSYRVLWIFGLLIVLIFGFLIDKTLLSIFKSCCCSKMQNQKIHPSDEEVVTYQKELPRLQHYGIESYDINKNFKYKDIVDAINNVYKEDLQKKNWLTDGKKMEENTALNIQNI